MADLTRLGTLRIIAFVNLHQDSPNAEVRQACRELLVDLESRLLTDLIEHHGLTADRLLENSLC